MSGQALSIHPRGFVGRRIPRALTIRKMGCVAEEFNTFIVVRSGNADYNIID